MRVDQTKIYDGNEIENVLIERTIKEVALILEERGYHPIHQLVGYLMSGDPGYISNHKGARRMITQFEQSKVLEVMIRKFLS